MKIVKELISHLLIQTLMGTTILDHRTWNKVYVYSPVTSLPLKRSLRSVRR